MKRFFIAAAATCLSMTCLAQESTPVEYNGWGVRVSADITMPGKWKTSNGEKVKMYKNGWGIAAGAVYNHPLGKNFYIEPGASLFYDTYEYDDLMLSTGDNPVTANPSVNKFGLRIPVVIGYRFVLLNRLEMSVFTGPELSYALSGKIKVKDEWNLGDDLPTDLFGKHGYRRADCRWRAGLGIYPDERWMVSVSGAFGLIDQHKNDLSFHENMITISVGYDF
ncbi:MAG: PorT family protein [Duncaniella sp.]|nr:PorT family protein [Duncaniella sp.]